MLPGRLWVSERGRCDSGWYDMHDREGLTDLGCLVKEAVDVVLVRLERRLEHVVVHKVRALQRRC